MYTLCSASSIMAWSTLHSWCAGHRRQRWWPPGFAAVPLRRKGPGWWAPLFITMPLNPGAWGVKGSCAALNSAIVAAVAEQVESQAEHASQTAPSRLQSTLSTRTVHLDPSPCPLACGRPDGPPRIETRGACAACCPPPCSFHPHHQQCSRHFQQPSRRALRLGGLGLAGLAPIGCTRLTSGHGWRQGRAAALTAPAVRWQANSAREQQLLQCVWLGSQPACLCRGA